MGLFKKLQNHYGEASDEFAWHLEQRTREYVAQGMSLEEAEVAARKRMGNVTALMESTAESDSFGWFENLKRDLKFAWRMLRRTPTVTVVAVLSLGLGIGANTAVFTLMKQLVLDYLPVSSPEQLVIIHNQQPERGHVYGNGMDSSFSYPTYKDLNSATSKIFDGILASRPVDISLSGRAATETVHGGLVSGNFFQVLGVTAWRGRMFGPSDDTKPGVNPVAILGYGLWQRAFGGDVNVLGQTIELNKHPYVVVGIAPPQFYGIDVSNRVDLYVPMSMKADVVPDPYLLSDRSDHWANLMARMRPGLSAQQASAALSVIYPPIRDQDFTFIKRVSPQLRQEYARKQVTLTSGGQGYASVRDQLSSPLRILMVMVGIVLLITVVNVANLLIARGVARQREMAIRLSVGAGKATLIWQLLIESLVLAAMGGLLGLAIAYSGTPALLHALSFDLNSASISARPDWRVMLFAAGITLAAGLIFGLLPAWQSTRTDVGAALKSEGSFGSTGHTGWMRRMLVVAQVALSLVLLTSAILFTRSLQNLKNINPGFDTARVVKFSVNPLQAGYSQARIKSFAEELRLKLDALPGVESAALATVPLLEDSDEGGDITIEGEAPVTRGKASLEYLRNAVSPAFFTTLKIPLLAGHAFDSSATKNIAVVNQTFVKQFLHGREPIGLHFGFGEGDKVQLTQTIVGVVADSEHSSIRAKIQPFIYLPYLTAEHLDSLSYYVRVRSNEETVAPAVRRAVHQLDADLPVNQLSSMTEIINESLFVEQSLGYLSIGFAVLATLLAVVGLYGVMSYSVTSRSREIGIRMAIGASPKRMLSAVLREAAFLGLAGTVCGIPALFATANYIRASLYGVRPDDAMTWCFAILLLVCVALLAGLVPALQAARIQPQEALRSS